MPTPGETILEARNVSVSYGMEPVLTDISLTLIAGNPPVGVIGASGSGKTTLVDTLRGVLHSTGSVTWNGRSPARLGRKDKKTFAGAVRHVSQYGVPTRDPRLTVEKYLAGAIKDARRAGRTHPTSVPALLEFVALEERYATRTLTTLSGGERQRLALAHALATRPDLLLLDEPLTAIDPGLRSEILRRLASLTADLTITVLLVSHDLESVERLCEEVHVLADGRFVASGSLREVLANSTHPAVRDIAEAAP